MNANPFRELFALAVAIRDETLARHSYTVAENVSPWPHYSRYAPQRLTLLQEILGRALLAAKTTGCSTDEVSRRLRAAEAPLRRLIVWERDAGARIEEPLNPDWVPEHFPASHRAKDISLYLMYYGSALAQSLPALHELVLLADSRHLEAANAADRPSKPATEMAATLDERALSLFFADKSRTKKAIADMLHVQTQSLSPARCPQLDTALKAWRSSNAARPPRGKKDQDGNLEAWEEDT